MTLQSQSKHTCITRLVLTSMFLAAAWVSASAQTQTNTFPPSGNAGIGTMTPTEPLEIIKNQNAGTTLAVDNSYTSAGNAAYSGFWFRQSGANRFFLGAVNDGNTTQIGGPGATHFWNFANGPMLFATNNSERMRITSSGNVGIGTAIPGSLLQITNGAQPTFTVETTGTTGKGRVTAAVPDWLGITQNARFDGANWNLDNTSDPGWLLKLDSRGSADVFEIARFSSGTNPRTYTPLFTIDSAGDVGIGTSSSNVAYKLDVNGAINATGLNVNGSPVMGSQWGNGSGNINYTSGNVGIGTTSPNAMLDVHGNLSVTGGGTNNTVKVLSTSSLSGGAYIQNTQASAQAIIYVENNRGSFASYGGFLYGGSNNAIGNLFGVSRTDKMFLFADGASNLGMAVGTLVAQPLILGTHNVERMRVDSSGNVGIGKTDPQYKLDVVGDIKASGTIHAKYQDLAEWVPSSEQLAAGTVVVLDTSKSNQVISATVSYDTRVAGVINAQPGITLGESGEGKVLVATTGRVRVKVDASRGAIQIGDLLVTSDVAGVAMKSEPVEFAGRKMHMPGTIIGKALEPLAKGSGEILVLLSLQ